MWTAYSTGYIGEDESRLNVDHPNPSNWDGTLKIYTKLPNTPINPIDTTGTIGEVEDTRPEYTSQQVIDLIRTHNGAVLLTPGMATEIMHILQPEKAEEF